MVDARRPVAAGVFYPAERAELARTVRQLLVNVKAPIQLGSSPATRVRAIVAPHSAYSASGAVAAAAWNWVAPQAKRIRRVVILAPTHHLPFSGVAAPFADAFETPLGIVAVDRLAIETARRFPQLIVSDVPHEQEHSVEGQLPFLQTVLDGSAAIVPLVVGDRSDEGTAEILDTLWDDTTLVVVSTDLSHYYDAGMARRLDETTARAIESLRPEVIDEQHACGYVALRALVRAARARGLQGSRLAIGHSGDETGELSEVVGFGAFAFA